MDSSAVLAALFGEPGADRVRLHLLGGVMSVVNYAEVLWKMIERGTPQSDATETLDGFALNVVPMDVSLAVAAARLTLVGKKAVPSLGASICLALALERDDEALTAEHAWASAPHRAKVTQIR